MVEAMSIEPVPGEVCRKCSGIQTDVARLTVEAKLGQQKARDFCTRSVVHPGTWVLVEFDTIWEYIHNRRTLARFPVSVIRSQFQAWSRNPFTARIMRSRQSGINRMWAFDDEGKLAQFLIEEQPEGLGMGGVGP